MDEGDVAVAALGRRLEEVKGQCTGQPVVLLSTGSFNPIHRMHLYQFEMAREFLKEQHGLTVILGLISPSHDNYVRSKLRREALPWKGRATLCELAIRDHFQEHNDGSGFTIMVDPWEGMQGDFIDFPVVSATRRCTFTTAFPESNLLVLFLCGMDLYVKCGEHFSYTIAVPRPDIEPRTYTPRTTHCYLMKPRAGGKWEKDTDVSSSMMRNNRTKHALLGVTFPSVVEELLRIHWATPDT
eukprot:TRINITY_DN17969_c0_g1_i1.p1 TRINITY_DN17969_c0_g1~~TRINITY_DN17969_c0_g1_i1.p1  ORF type:complete len:262 (+),score=45.45 TRINITY_DN17969_c0_g1_i1:66-788(+)